MAIDYSALIAKWATLTPGTTAQKLAQINAIAITGSIPTTIYVTGDQVANCIVWSEFAALTAQQQSNVLGILQIPGLLLGGSSHTTSLLVGALITYFPLAGGTIANLTALSQAIATPWWQVPIAQNGGGLNSPVNNSDLMIAGGLT